MEKEEGVEGESKDGGKWKKMLHQDCNKKEPQRRRAIRPAAVIHFHLNPWTLNDFPWVETACQHSVCVRVCVRVCGRERETERKRECVHAYISRSNPSFHRLSTPQYHTLFSLCPISFPPFHLYPATAPLCHQEGSLLFSSDVHLFCPVCLQLLYWSLGS